MLRKGLLWAPVHLFKRSNYIPIFMQIMPNNTYQEQPLTNLKAHEALLEMKTGQAHVLGFFMVIWEQDNTSKQKAGRHWKQI